VWRVEAAAGRSSPAGVYELVRDPLPAPVPSTSSSTSSSRLPSQSSSGASSEGAGPPGTWRLARVDD
jgi:hypothetical protein